MPQAAASQDKKTIAVFFGGRSPEHDVSVVSGLQALHAIDRSRYDAFGVYITPEGRWLTGAVLHDRAVYMPDGATLERTQEVTLDVCAKGRPALIARKKGLLGRARVTHFDVAVPAFHGLVGEDGQIQGLFETAGVPYTGMRTMASAVLMDKGATKHILKALNIPALPFAVLRRPEKGYLIPDNVLRPLVEHISFPACLKPVHLGSSIGVAKVNAVEDIGPCLPAIFEHDSAAILEPFVEDLVEYNVAVARIDGQIRLSAVEKPKNKEDLLDFKQKYLSGGDQSKTGIKGGGGTKDPGQISEGMLSLTRELNPKLSPEQERHIRDWAVRLFEALEGTGAPRIDFIGNGRTGELWLNEVNPCPGSFGYFLWEAAQEPLLFTELLNLLIDEALAERRKNHIARDPVPVAARLFRRAE